MSRGRNEYPYPQREEPSFLADAMLGKLARWLRVLGGDVLYDVSMNDNQLLSLARLERRVLLTRDRPLARIPGAPRKLLIQSTDYREQLVQVVRLYQLDPFGDLFSRCLSCNGILSTVSRQSVKEDVPAYVFATQEQFKKCADCHKTVWRGTHRERMLSVVRELFAPDGVSAVH